MVDAIPSTLPDTQTQQAVDWTQGNEITVTAPWAWLNPTRLHLKTIDISDPIFILGRAPHCDVVLDGSNLSPNILRIVSKEHFKIFRDPDSVANPIPIYLQDCSYNGTFVNGIKVGRGNKIILQNNDEIAIGHPTVKVYVIKCIYDTEDLPEEITSKYIVSKLLGTGAFGEVKLIWDRRSCKRYAMKKITKSKFLCSSRKPDLNDPKKIMNEVEILKALKHPCVIEMQDIIDTEDAVYIILELMEGGELFDRITAVEQLPESTAKLYFYQMVLAVKYLHEAGITHRDLKPENMLLVSAQEETLLKVSDFGLSKFVQQESVMKTVCGTPMYVAPEILLTGGQGSYTKQVDIWSLGVILYVLVSGFLPFTNDDPNRTLNQQIIKGQYSDPSKVFKGTSPDVIDLVNQMLVVNPTKRITIDEILDHAWLRDSYMIMKAERLMGIDHALSSVDLNANSDSFEPRSKRPRLLSPNDKTCSG